MSEFKVGDKVRGKASRGRGSVWTVQTIIEDSKSKIRLWDAVARVSAYVTLSDLNEDFELVPMPQQIKWLKVGDLVRRKSRGGRGEYKSCVVTDLTLTEVTLDDKEKVGIFGFVDQFEFVSGDGMRVSVPNPMTFKIGDVVRRKAKYDNKPTSIPYQKELVYLGRSENGWVTLKREVPNERPIHLSVRGDYFDQRYELAPATVLTHDKFVPDHKNPGGGSFVPDTGKTHPVIPWVAQRAALARECQSESRIWRQKGTLPAEIEQHVPGIPAGYVAVAWREYKAGELYLKTDNSVGGPALRDQSQTVIGAYYRDGRRKEGVKRLILKKVEPTKSVLPGVPDGYEAVRWGVPRDGDRYVYHDKVVCAKLPYGSHDNDPRYLVVKPVEPPKFDGKLSGIPEQEWLVKRWGIPQQGEPYVNVKGKLKVGPESEGYHRLCVIPVKNVLQHCGDIMDAATKYVALHSVAPGAALFVDKDLGKAKAYFGVDWAKQADKTAILGFLYGGAVESVIAASWAAQDKLKLEHEWINHAGDRKWVVEGGVIPLGRVRTGRSRLAAERDCEVEWKHKTLNVCGWFEAGTRPDGGWFKTGQLRKLPVKGPSPVGEAMKQVPLPTEYEFQNRHTGCRAWFQESSLPSSVDWFATAKAR